MRTLHLTHKQFDVLYELLHDHVCEIKTSLDDESELETFVSNEIYQTLCSMKEGGK